MTLSSLEIGLDPDRLLDRDLLLRHLGPALSAGGASLRAIEPNYVRAKRGVSAMIGLKLTWSRDGETIETRGSWYVSSRPRVRAAAAKAQALLLRDAGHGPAAAVLDDPSGLYLAFPNDRALRGLPAAVDPRRLKNRLHRLGAPFSADGTRVRHRKTVIEVLRWKPGRRAVLCARLALRDLPAGRKDVAPLFARVYPARHLLAALARWRAVAAIPVGAPRVVAADVERGFFLVTERPGRPEFDLGEAGSASWSALAASLRALHAWNPESLALEHRGDRDDLIAARRALSDLADWAPEQGARCRAADAALVSAGRRMKPAPGRVVHGDLTADQILVHEGGMALIDWDEAAVGDPHADLASFAADLALRRAGMAPPGSCDRLAREALGAAWDEERWRWQMALAHARRCLSGLQRADRDWRETASRALDESLRWVPPSPARRRRPAGLEPARERRLELDVDAPGPPHGLDSSRGDGRHRDRPLAYGGVESALRSLHDPADRARLARLGPPVRVAAVWPDGDGAMACLETSGAPHGGRVWLRMRATLERWEFPGDPALAALRELVESGSYDCAGHRLARRATLRDRRAPVYVHLRPRRIVDEVHGRMAAVHEALLRARVSCPELLGRHDERGWRTRAMAGTPLDPVTAPVSVWKELGHALARVHGVTVSALPWTGLDAAAAATERQIRLVHRAGVPPAEWLAAMYERWRPRATGEASRRVLVHGDLHPSQILVDAEARTIGIVDWERAHLGEPEEDLGNLAAHLRWAMGSDFGPAWPVLSAGYRDGGGRFDAGRAALYERLALLRVIAIHSWRDGERARCLDPASWVLGLEECER